MTRLRQTLILAGVDDRLLDQAIISAVWQEKPNPMQVERGNLLFELALLDYLTEKFPQLSYYELNSYKLEYFTREFVSSLGNYLGLAKLFPTLVLHHTLYYFISRLEAAQLSTALFIKQLFFKFPLLPTIEYNSEVIQFGNFLGMNDRWIIVRTTGEDSKMVCELLVRNPKQLIERFPEVKIRSCLGMGIATDRRDAERAAYRQAYEYLFEGLFPKSKIWELRQCYHFDQVDQKLVQAACTKGEVSYLWTQNFRGLFLLLHGVSKEDQNHLLHKKALVEFAEQSIISQRTLLLKEYLETAKR